MRQTTLPGRAGRGLGALIGAFIGVGIGLLWAGMYGAGSLEPYANLVVVLLMLAGIVIGFFAGRTVGRFVRGRGSGR